MSKPTATVKIYLMAQRKYWDHELPDGWKEVAWERFDYVECGIYEKPENELTEEDRKLIEYHGKKPEDWVEPYQKKARKPMSTDEELDRILDAITGRAATQAFMAIDPGLNLRSEIVDKGRRFLAEIKARAKADIQALIERERREAEVAVLQWIEEVSDRFYNEEFHFIEYRILSKDVEYRLQQLVQQQETPTHE